VGRPEEGRKHAAERPEKSKSVQCRSEARQPRTVRFSDSEWSLIERAAARHGIPAGELIRSVAVAAAKERLGEPPPTTLSNGHAALIEQSTALYT